MPKKKAAATKDAPAKLVGTSRAGDFVHENQTMGAKKGFRNVSKTWLDQCLTFDQVMEQVERHHEQIEDFAVPFSLFQPALDDDGRFVMRHQGRDYTPTHFSLKHIAEHAGLSPSELEVHAGVKPDGNNRFHDQPEDRACLLGMLQTYLRHIPRGKDFLFRTQTDGTLRAWLSRDYLIMDNRWFLRILHDIVPGALFSHWREDGDLSTLWGNILIPDSIREEQDSAYGGMLSVGNSEIGRRSISCRPSLFRAICMNGCILGRKKGETYSKVHRGKAIDDAALLAFRDELRRHVTAQIPLIGTVIDRLLGTRSVSWDGMSAMPMFAAVGHELGLTRRANAEILAAWKAEANRPETEDLRKTAFAVINAVTRSGRDATNPEVWVRRDELGGKLLEYSGDRWNRLIASARAMKGDEVAAAFPASLN